MINFFKARCKKWEQFDDIELLAVFSRLTRELGMLWDAGQSREQVEHLIDWMAVEKGKRVAANQPHHLQ